MTRTLSLLVGDNPFHGISHLSQERARERVPSQIESDIDRSTRIVELCIENSANGFMFSVDEMTLSIIENLQVGNPSRHMDLYAIVPYAYEYVRKATQVGGVSGLAKQLSTEMIFSSNAKVIAQNLGGLIRLNPTALLKTYVSYELSRIKTVSSANTKLKSIMLHEMVTDMALSLGMKELFTEYIKFLTKKGIRPGFETRNFAWLVNKFEEWDIKFEGLTLTSAFNKIGFQMNPSPAECENALKRAKEAEVIAMSILAAGYLNLSEAIDYAANLEGLSGVVVGVSKEAQAIETFRTLSRVSAKVEVHH